MGTILRLHQEADNNIKDWTGSKNCAYGSSAIEQIQDPGGARADKEITSIPSPFARIDLAKSAFANVAGSRNLAGKTIFHKIVSDCLDIGELFFNYDKFSDKLEVIVWNREKEIEKLEKSPSESHKILGKTLKMYLEQDRDAYNFEKMDNIFLLRYKGNGRKGEMDILGATSPRTLFFSSANDLSYCSDYLRQGGKDRPFDDEYTPLYERDFSFQRYLYALRISSGKEKFATCFPEFNAYLQESLSHLSDVQKTAIDEMNESSIESYPLFSFGGNTVEVIGIKLRKGNAISTEEFKSDFFIDSERIDGRKPLVLPIDHGNTYEDLLYIKDNWQKDDAAPVSDIHAVEDRILPGSGDKYPYLTISDFLTEAIIKMPFKMTDSFFNGNLEGKEFSVLLPLKDTFFKYFTPTDLMEKMPDGKSMIEIGVGGDGDIIEVTLRIPVQKGRYIEYTRQYHKYSSEKQSDNTGSIKESKFGLGILPPVDHNAMNLKPFCRVAYFSRNKNSRLRFAGDSECKVKEHVSRREAGDLCSVESYVLEEAFNRIYIEIDGVKNVAIPVLKKYGNARKYTFAIDFGTTNTHIEYTIDGGRVSHAFDIKSSEQQMARMHSDYYNEIRDIDQAFKDAFIPQTIGDNDDYSFPIRTAFAESRSIDYRKPTESLADGNIPFCYEKTMTPDYSNIKTDLKWSNEDKELVKLYLDNLMFLIRNKVILGNGNLEETKIVWFYPASMTKAQYVKLSDIWKELYDKYFGSNSAENLMQISESTAPYYFCKRELGGKSNVVTIDIGGGTTDVYVVEEKTPKMLSSFRFAANSIFGDGYNFPWKDNGFITTFKDEIRKILEANKKDELIAALDSIPEGKSTDAVAFFFSLASSKDSGKTVDFLDMLSKDGKLKYTFVIFYGAILYYVANMMKAKGLALPQTLAFSGNGSKTLKVLSTDKETLAKFTRLIFEKVYGEKYEKTRLEVICEDEPKLATCKGGISCLEEDRLNYDQIENLKTSLLGTDMTTFAEGKRYSDIGNKEINDIANTVADCIDFLFKINDANKNFFASNFDTNASIIGKVKEICREDLVEYTKQGKDRKLKELKSWGIGEDAEIEETLFFYPIVAMLSRLASEIIK